jgi:type III secretion system chaperone SycN
VIPAWANELLREFGQQIVGLPALTLDARGVSGIVFDTDETLYFHWRGETLGVSLLWRCEDYHRLAACERVMAACHYRHGRLLQVQPGLLRDNVLALTASIDQANANCAYLDATVMQLRSLANDSVSS